MKHIFLLLAVCGLCLNANASPIVDRVEFPGATGYGDGQFNNNPVLLSDHQTIAIDSVDGHVFSVRPGEDPHLIFQVPGGIGISGGVQVFQDGSIALVANNGTVYFLDGHRNLVATATSVYSNTHVAMIQGTILVVAKFREVVFFNSQGNLLWKFKLSEKIGDEVKANPIVLKNGYVVISTGKKTLILDPIKQNVRQEFEVGVWNYPPLLLKNGNILALTLEGAFLADRHHRIKQISKVPGTAAVLTNGNMVLLSEDGQVGFFTVEGTLLKQFILPKHDDGFETRYEPVQLSDHTVVIVTKEYAGVTYYPFSEDGGDLPGRLPLQLGVALAIPGLNPILQISPNTVLFQLAETQKRTNNVLLVDPKTFQLKDSFQSSWSVSAPVQLDDGRYAFADSFGAVLFVRF